MFAHSRYAAALSLGLAGCMLDPLVDDTPGHSVHVLPPGSEVPDVDDDPELVHQITVNDGLDDAAMVMSGGVVPRLTGWAGGVQVRYWSFGKASRAGAQAYVFVDAAGQPIAHPHLFDTVPGDPGYSPIRRLQEVKVTARYAGERIPTIEALADAIELGLVEEPRALGTWVNAPVVPPGVRVDVMDGVAPAEPVAVYARGHRVSAFVFGADRGVQPLRNGSVPSGQAAQLREGTNTTFVAAPVFQYTIPAEPPTMAFNYTPLATLIEVQVVAGAVAMVKGDADLFARTMTGAIRATTPNVTSFTITTTVVNWPMQFVEGQP